MQSISDPQALTNVTLWSTEQIKSEKLKKYYENNRSDRTHDDNERAKALRHVLDWMSQCFVQLGHGDVVSASAVPNHDSRSITILLVNNNCAIPEQAEMMTANFVSWNEKIQGPSGRNLSSIKESFLKGISQTCWLRFARRCTLLKESGSKNYIRDLYQTWRKLDNLGSTDSLGTPVELRDAAEACYGSRGKTRDTVKKYLEDLMDMTYQIETISDTETAKSNFFLMALCRASYVAASPYMRIMHPKRIATVTMFDKLRNFVIKLETRIKKIARYATGAEKYIIQGLPLLKQIAQTNVSNKLQKLEVKFKWIPDESKNKDVAIDDKPEVERLSVTTWFDTQLSDVVKSLGPDVISKSSATVKAEIHTGVSKLKGSRENVVFNNRFHCEITMILYLLTHDIKAKYNVIGVSKLSCSACSSFIKFLERTPETYWDLSGTSSKSHHQWRLPVEDLFIPKIMPPTAAPPPIHKLQELIKNAKESFMDDIHNDFKSALKRRVISTATKARAGSDSSTGSRWVLFDDEDWEVIPEFSEAIKKAVNIIV